MAGWDDVRRIALELPETSETSARDLISWRVRDRAFVWERPLRVKEVETLGDAAPAGPILGAYVEDLGAKQALLASEPTSFFTTPHFDGYPVVLVRLERVPFDVLRETIVEAWICRAPKRLAREYVGAQL